MTSETKPLTDEEIEAVLWRLSGVLRMEQLPPVAREVRDVIWRLVRDLRAARVLLGASKSFLRHLTPEAQGTAGAALLTELAAFLGGPSGEAP